MHPAQQGQIVMIECIITDVSATEDYCNVSYGDAGRSKAGQQQEHINAINTGVLTLLEKAARQS